MGVAMIFSGGIFSTIFKTIFKKFSKNFQKSFKKFSKIFKNFLKKINKKCIILADFSQNLTKHALNFCEFGRKRQFIGNFEKTFENFEMFSSENC